MFFSLFTSCKIVSGINQSIIIDTQRNFYHIIPKSLFSIIKDLKNKSIAEVKYEIEEESKLIFESYIDYLIENEFGFITTDPKKFKYVDIIKVNKPSHNIILDFPIIKDVNLLEQMNNPEIEALHININTTIKYENLNDILKQIMQKTSIRFVSVLLQYQDNITEKELIKISELYPILGQIIIHSSPFEKNMNSIIFVTKSITRKHCGIINANLFSCNTSLYNETQYFNSCLAGKIAIDFNGNIKNCPSMPQNFGNIKNTTLEEVLNHKDFKKYWNLTKDSIKVCKDCEFRYICTDCRAYTEQTDENTEGLDISKPLKCGYNPYTCEWEEWSTNPLKQKAIEYYGLNDIKNNS